MRTRCDPRFPKLEDYDVEYHLDEVDGRWTCLAFGRTEAALEVQLETGRGKAKEAAFRWLKRSYIYASQGSAAAEAFFPWITADF